MEPLIYSQLVRTTGDNLGLQQASEAGGGGWAGVVEEGRQSCGTEPLTWGIWCSVQVSSVRIELNYRTQSRCRRELLGVGKISIHFVTRSEVFSGYTR